MIGNPQNTTLSQIRRLVADQGKKHWRNYALAFVFMTLAGIATSLTAYMMKHVVNKIFVDKQAGAVLLISGIVVAIYVTKGFCTYGQQVTLAKIANAIVADIQNRLYDHMLRLRMTAFDDRHSSDFIARQWFIVSSAGRALNLIVTALGRDLITLIGLVTVMIIQDPIMSVIGLITLPFAVTSIRSLIKRSKKIVTQEFSGALIVMETIQETAKGIRTVKSFRLEPLFKNKMTSAILSFEMASNKLSKVGARSAPLMESLGGLAIAGIILYGGYRVISSGQSPGEFFSFITALLLAYEPAKRLARVHIDLSAALVGVDMLYQFLENPETETFSQELPALKITDGCITFEDVHFGYRPTEPVLKGLSFTADAGKVTAVIGTSGGGKTTIISLLQRFYDIDSGSITIDGHDIMQVSLSSLRDQIAVVSQDIFLFRGTIRENIAYGRPDASDEDIGSAAKAAFAHDFIMGLQNGYESQVGEGGHQLSGGQRQRIAIARAILKNADILLLDEATSSLDIESESAVQRGLQTLCSNKTVIVVAHRLQTIRGADKIVVIEDGRVIEEGDHNFLLKNEGRYHELKTMLA